MEYKYSSDELQDDSDNRSFITIHDSCDSLYDSHGNSIVTSDDGYDSQASTVILSDNDEILDVMLSPEEVTFFSIDLHLLIYTIYTLYPMHLRR